MIDERYDLTIQTYKKNLRKAHQNNPGKFAWGIGKLDAVVSMTGEQIKKVGIGGITITTAAWKATAKELGIKNTHKAWREYLG